MQREEGRIYIEGVAVKPFEHILCAISRSVAWTTGIIGAPIIPLVHKARGRNNSDERTWPKGITWLDKGDRWT